MIASTAYEFAWMPPRTPAGNVTLYPRVNRLTYRTTSFEPVKREDHPYQEGQMVVSGDHVLGAQIEERGDCGAMVRLDE